jgi:hypothetical protein
MKKLLFVILVSLLAFGLFADDAKVLPKSVIRLYAVPSYAFGSQSFDGDGEKIDYASGDYSFFNLGGAFEYGVTDWISAALQWAPGANLYSDFADFEQQHAEGPFELFAGAKIQIVGPAAPVQSDSIRFALAPGVMIPMNFSYDVAEEAANYVSTLTFIGSAGAAGSLQDFNADPANSTLGLGGRFYLDYLATDFFFINLYSEFIKYLEKDADKDFAASAAGSTLGVNYGFKLTSEMDFNFTKQINDGMSMSGGLPVGFVYNPETTYGDAEADSENASYTMYINPDVSVFVYSLPLPLEFQLSYKVPLMGQNSIASSTLTFQIKAYMKF